MASEFSRAHEMQAGIFKAIGHPLRLRILKYLVGGERTVSEIFRAVEVPQPNVSRHLALLREAGVLTCRRSGLKVFYKISSSEMMDRLTRVLMQPGLTSEAHGGGDGGHASRATLPEVPPSNPEVKPPDNKPLVVHHN